MAKALIAFNAHYGCWEMSSAATMKQYPKVAGIYRPLDNPMLDEGRAAHPMLEVAVN